MSRSCATTRSRSMPSRPWTPTASSSRQARRARRTRASRVELITRLGPDGAASWVSASGHQAMGLVYGGEVIRVEPVHGKRSAVSHAGQGVLRRAPLSARRGPLPLAGHRPRLAARGPRGHGVGRRRAGHGRAASRVPGRGHPVPSGVDPDRRWRADAVDLAGVGAGPRTGACLTRPSPDRRRPWRPTGSVLTPMSRTANECTVCRVPLAGSPTRVSERPPRRPERGSFRPDRAIRAPSAPRRWLDRSTW